jgi:spore maturation protein CgeB
MRIFYAADNALNNLFQSNLWRNNLYLPLVDLGHEVVEFDYDLKATFEQVDMDDPWQRAFIKRNRPVVSRELLRQVSNAHAEKPLDLFFSYFYDACIEPETIKAIRKLGIVTVNWYCNGAHQLHKVREISPHYDWCLVPEKFRLKDYVAMGARPIYCQEAANPKIYHPYDLQTDYDVTFIGQSYGERPAYIRYLLERGIDIRVWGYGWQALAGDGNVVALPMVKRLERSMRKLFTQEGRQVLWKNLLQVAAPGQAATLPSYVTGGPLSDEEMVQLFSRSRINLGFSSCGETHVSGERIVQVRLRDFEVPMSGGFYMVERMAELEEFFEIDKEIVCYDGPDDLADKIHYYLAHEDERELIRLAGHQRCLRDHSWQKRLSDAFRSMGFVS